MIQDVSISASATRSITIEETAFEHQPVPALVVDRQGKIVAINRLARKLFVSVDFSSALPYPQLSKILSTDTDSLMREIIMGASVGFITLPVKDENEAPDRRRRFSVTPLKSQPRYVNQFLLTLTPVAPAYKDFIQLNEAVREANIAAVKKHHLLQKLEISYERVSEFNAMVSHDLQGPLRNIRGFLQILEQDHGKELSAEGIDVLLRATQSATRLQTLIISLLDHARTNSSSINLETVQMVEAVRRIRDDLRTTIEQCGGHLELIGNIDTLDADPVLFNQLLENLISNAFKYRSPERSPVVQISSVRIPDKEYEITIKDNGLGFDNMYRERIMKPFQRLHSYSDIEGTGIGLATCTSICDLHGWTLSCNGEPGIGATFTIRMPVST